MVHLKIQTNTGRVRFNKEVSYFSLLTSCGKIKYWLDRIDNIILLWEWDSVYKNGSNISRNKTQSLVKSIKREERYERESKVKISM